MYQLLLCANSTLITLGQLSFLNKASTSWYKQKTHTCNRFQQYWVHSTPDNMRYLNRCCFRDFSQDDDATLVIWPHFFALLVNLDHRWCCRNQQKWHQREAPWQKYNNKWIRRLHRSTSKMRSMSVVRTLIPSMLAIVQMGTNWSLSIWDIR